MGPRPDRDLKPGKDFKSRKGLIGLSFAVLLGILGGYVYVKVNPPSAKPVEDLSKETFRIGSLFKIKSLHPYGPTDYLTVLSSIYGALAGTKASDDDDRNYAGFLNSNDLLESLETIGDGRVALLHVRKNVYFHNGAILKASDIVYTFKTHFREIVRNLPLLHEKDFKFDVVDDFTAKFTCAYPMDWMAFILERPILNEAYERGWEGKDISSYMPMGTGPYRYASFDLATGVLRLERFQKYWMGTPAIGFVEHIPFDTNDAALQAMAEGKIDYLPNLSPDDEEYLLHRVSKDVTIEKVRGSGLFSLIFNTRIPKYQDWRVRRGISRLINRYEIVNDKVALNLTGIMSDSPFHQTIPYTTPTVEPFEPSKGMRLLEDAGYRKNNGWYEKNGKRLELEILFPNYAQGYLHVLRLIERQLGLAGITCKIKRTGWDEYFQNLKKSDFEVAFTEINDFQRLASTFAFLARNGENNFSGYDDSFIDNLYTKIGYTKPSVSEKKAIQDRIREKAPIISLFYKTVPMALNTKYLGGWFYEDPFQLTSLYKARVKNAPMR